jgi:hypothetical protein
MNQHYILYRRADSKQTSLRTKDKAEAPTLFEIRGVTLHSCRRRLSRGIRSGGVEPQFKGLRRACSEVVAKTPELPPKPV